MSVCQCLTQCICVNVLLMTKNIRLQFDLIKLFIWIGKIVTIKMFSCIHELSPYHFTSHDVTKFTNFEKYLFLQMVKVKGQTQGQGQLKVKSQGHIIVFTILDVIAVIPFNLWKQNIRALHTIYLNNYNQIDYALDLWPLTFDIWPWLVTIKVNHAVKT